MFMGLAITMPFSRKKSKRSSGAILLPCLSVDFARLNSQARSRRLSTIPDHQRDGLLLSFLFRMFLKKCLQDGMGGVDRLDPGGINFFLSLDGQIDQAGETQVTHVMGEGGRTQVEALRQFGRGQFFLAEIMENF
jgi:hypothetical protein